MKVKSFSRVRLFVTLWTVAYQVPPSMGFSKQEYWSGVPSPSPYLFLMLLNLSSLSWTVIKISFRINWFDLLVVQGTLQAPQLKASILWLSTFFMVHLSHP